VGFAIALSGCADGWFHDPAPTGAAAVQVVFQQSAQASAAFDAADNIAVDLSADGSGLFAGTVDVAANGGSIEVPIQVDLPDGAVTAGLTVQLRRAGDALFSASAPVSLVPGETTRVVLSLTPVIDRLEISAPPTFTAWGQSFTLGGSAVFATGDPIPGGEVAWSSLDPGIVRIDRIGSAYRATSVGDGSASLRASFEGRTATVAAVVDARVASIEVSPSSVTLAPGESVDLTATLKDANGNVLPRVPTWSSSDENVATVSASGRVTGVATGTADIVAARDGVSSRAALDVRAGAPRVTTLPPNVVAFDEAVLRARVEPGPAVTTVVFDYGTVPDLSDATRTAPSVVGANAGPTDVSRTATGLPGGTTLYVRAIATNSFGSSTGSIIAFTTPVAPPNAPTGLSGAYTGTVRLTWQDNSSDEIRFDIEREVLTGQGNGTAGPGPVARRDASGPQRVFQPLGSVGAGVTTFDDLNPPTGELRYRVRACSATACSDWTPALTWFYGLPPLVLTRPATNVGFDDATVSALVNPQNAPTTVVWEFGFEPTFTTPPPTALPTQPLDAGVGNVDVFRQFTATGLQPGSTYWVRAVATNPWGTTVGSPVMFTTSGAGD
jgi:hypothetical protein